MWVGSCGHDCNHAHFDGSFVPDYVPGYMGWGAHATYDGGPYHSGATQSIHPAAPP